MATLNSTARYLPIMTRLTDEFYDTGSYLAPRLAPSIYVPEKSAAYYQWDKENILNRARARRRAPGDSVHRFQLKLSGDSYQTHQYALGFEIPDEVRAEYASVVNLNEAGTRGVVDGHAYETELQLIDQMTGAGIPGAASGAAWNNGGVNDPLGEVKAAKNAIRTATGLMPNTMVITYNMAEALETNAQILELFKGVITLDGIGVDHFRRAFKITNIIVADKLDNPNNEGQAFAAQDMWPDDHVFLMYISSAADIPTPNAFATFRYTGVSGIPRLGSFGRNVAKMFSHYDDEHYVNKFDGFAQWGLKRTGPDLIYRITGAFA